MIRPTGAPRRSPNPAPSGRRGSARPHPDGAGGIAVFAAFAAACAAITLAVAGCGSRPQRPESSSAPLTETCPDGSPPLARLGAITMPLPTPMQSSSDGSPRTLGTVGRRLILSAGPEDLAPGTRMIWSRLSIRSFGGTFNAVTRVVTDFSSLELSPSSEALVASKRRRRQEILSVELSPGEITVSRSALQQANLFGTVVLDLTVTPGGVPVDETVVHIAQLWKEGGAAVAPRDVDIQLAPVRHPPGIDGIDALFTLEYTLQRGRAPRWRCMVETSGTLVSKAQARPPLWDLGVSTLNEERTAWLALYDRRLGPIRAIFDSPEAATAFADWGRKSRATTAGRFSIGLFTETARVPLRPGVPVDSTIAETWRPIAPDEWDTVRAGPLGEP